MWEQIKDDPTKTLSHNLFFGDEGQILDFRACH